MNPLVKSTGLAPRGCLVRVTSGARQRWFAVGIYSRRMAEAAVCNLPEIEASDIVFARRSLKPAEIETLGLRRGQVVPCSVNNVRIFFMSGCKSSLIKCGGQPNVFSRRHMPRLICACPSLPVQDITDMACQLPPRAVEMPRASRASATARNVIAPAFWASLIMGNGQDVCGVLICAGPDRGHRALSRLGELGLPGVTTRA